MGVSGFRSLTNLRRKLCHPRLDARGRSANLSALCHQFLTKCLETGLDKSSGAGNIHPSPIAFRFRCDRSSMRTASSDLPCAAEALVKERNASMVVTLLIIAFCMCYLTRINVKQLSKRRFLDLRLSVFSDHVRPDEVTVASTASSTAVIVTIPSVSHPCNATRGAKITAVNFVQYLATRRRTLDPCDTNPFDILTNDLVVRSIEKTEGLAVGHEHLALIGLTPDRREVAAVRISQQSTDPAL